eukprot:171626-Rhodomonas_salina.1
MLARCVSSPHCAARPHVAPDWSATLSYVCRQPPLCCSSTCCSEPPTATPSLILLHITPSADSGPKRDTQARCREPRDPAVTLRLLH